MKLERTQPPRPMNETITYRVVREAAFRAGLGELCPKVLRHTFATHLLAGGADVRVVQELLGHARLDTTQIYTHVTSAAMAETYRRSHPRGAENRRIAVRPHLKGLTSAYYDSSNRSLTSLGEPRSVPHPTPFTEEIVLQPWFLDRKTCCAIKRLIPSAYFSKMRYYFEDYGCLRCGSKTKPYASDGMCNSCHSNAFDRIQKAVRRHTGTYAPDAPLKAIAARRKNAAKLLRHFYDATKADRARPRRNRCD